MFAVLIEFGDDLDGVDLGAVPSVDFVDLGKPAFSQDFADLIGFVVEFVVGVVPLLVEHRVLAWMAAS